MRLKDSATVIDKKLKICIVSREYPPDTLWGGIGTFTYNLAQGLKEIGHEVDVIALSLGQESELDDNGVTVHRLPSPRIPFIQKRFWDIAHALLAPFSILYSYKVYKKIKTLSQSKSYDVIDFPEHIGEGVATQFFNKYPCHVRLYTPLSLIGKLGLHRTTNRIDYLAIEVMERYSIKKALMVNCPSKALAELVKKEFCINRAIDIIPNPIDAKVFFPAADKETVNKLKRVLFVGRLDDRKGIHILAEAVPKVVSEFPGVEFIFLGNDGRGVSGHNSMKEYILKVLRGNNCEHAVVFRDRVQYKDLPSVYNSADISVVPSLYDNSPYTCLEAMSCGLPVIGTDAGGTPEYIDDGYTGLVVPPGNVNALAAALLDLLQNDEKCAEFGRNARKKVCRVFSRDVVAARMADLYYQSIEIFKQARH